MCHRHYNISQKQWRTCGTIRTSSPWWGLSWRWNTKSPWSSNLRKKINARYSSKPSIVQAHSCHPQAFGTLTEVLEKQANMNDYSNTSKVLETDPQSWSKVIFASRKTRSNALKKSKELGLHGVKVDIPFRRPLATAVFSQRYSLMKNLSRYDDDVAQELHKIAKNILV